ncbi:SPFH domain/Band 7 family protein [Blastomonas natatoria]|uniref:SPFH domain/Band 7 family protein n=1 Tax=Blastomonas natatoria TaxID=34015 RepID=A0A2V3VC01_9SPHN|nr:SPFH domain-containing protein [Blastomonas natatoria]PXW79100.1 SPFH domain/Band 7 family protein [Blastomonas natatoria]
MQQNSSFDGSSGGGAMVASTESPASTFNGYVFLLLMLVSMLLPVLGVGMAKSGNMLGLVLAGVSALAFLFIISGFYMLNPNEAAAIQLFGSYKGTDRNTGLRWRWPWLSRKKISVRVHNVTSEKVKVNDLRGNPVEIATNVVWRVSDTAKALFDVENYQEFVDIQIESAVRVIGARYPYDDFNADEVTLRGDADEVSHELEKQLQERVGAAGVQIDECRLTHLAYAPEIAQSMLRRQQAEAVIAARSRLVEGAVTMVEHALAMLSEKNVVHLDDERKAAMVSNLMVVLCGERDTQPVVNAGSLY